MDLKVKRQSLLREAKATVENAVARGKELSTAELKAIETTTAEVAKLDEQIRAVEEGQELIAQISAMSLALPRHDGSNPGWGVEGKEFLRLKSDAANAGLRLAHQIPRDGAGRKALVGAGAVTTSVLLDSNVIPMGAAAASLFDVLPTNIRTVPKYAYLRQVTRTNLAAVVPSGGLKPTTVYGIDAIDSQLQVLAHMSEPLDSYMLGDNSGLGVFIGNELSYGLNWPWKPRSMTMSQPPAASKLSPSRPMSSPPRGPP
jgi:hypothetical protein